VGDPEYSVVLFQSTSGALRAEKLSKGAGLKVKLIPVPRHLSSDCGVCLRCESADVHRVRSILDAARVEFDGICPLQGTRQ
jgi:hypothetical protein